jgi:hypothetical protein
VTYYRDSRVPAAIAASLFILTIPCLLLFAEGLGRRFRDLPVARAGVGGIYGMLASFGLVVALDQTINAMVHAGADTATVSVLFRLHAAAFVVNAALLGGSLLLLATGAHRAAGFAPWLRPLGMIGGSLLIIGSVPILAVTEGSPAGLPAFGGFICWLVWAAATGLTMVRR